MIIGTLSLLVTQRWQEGSLSVSFNMFAVAVLHILSFFATRTLLLVWQLAIGWMVGF